MGAYASPVSVASWPSDDARPYVLIRGKRLKVPEVYSEGAEGRWGSVNDQQFIQGLEQFLAKDIRDACARNSNPVEKLKPSDTKTALIYERVFADSCSWLHATMVACEECSWREVTGLKWYQWFELHCRWRRQQYSHFDTACQKPKGKSHFLFAIMMNTSYGCAPRYFRHLLAMSIKPTLHATAPLLYPCRRCPKCPWGLYASTPPVAKAVVGWFLCPPPPFWKKGFFFPIHDLRQK